MKYTVVQKVYSTYHPKKKKNQSGENVRVHVPFSLTDLSQIEKRPGSFTTDPDSYVRVPIFGSIL
jgi:hypothetical protein